VQAALHPDIMHIAKWLAKSSVQRLELYDAAQPYAKSMTCARDESADEKINRCLCAEWKVVRASIPILSPARAANNKVIWIGPLANSSAIVILASTPPQVE
jgi:hypothetical protein